MTEVKKTDMITVGRIVAPHGVRGDLRILPDTDRPGIFKTLPRLYAGGKAYRLLSARPHKNVYIVKLEGVEDRNGAEALVGDLAEVPFGELPPREKGSYYYFQLIGLAVVDEEGRSVGTLKEILQTGANDVYVVKGPKEEICLPAIPSCILSVDLAAGRMTVRLPEWE